MIVGKRLSIRGAILGDVVMRETGLCSWTEMIND